jgi:hypothetical protein
MDRNRFSASLPCGVLAPEHFGFNRPRRDRIHRDPGGSEFECPRSCEADHGAFGRGIDGAVRNAQHDKARQVHDTAPTPLPHIRQQRLDKLNGWPQVRPKHVVHGVQVDIAKWRKLDEPTLFTTPSITCSDLSVVSACSVATGSVRSMGTRMPGKPGSALRATPITVPGSRQAMGQGPADSLARTGDQESLV